MAELEKSLETLASVQLKLSNENAASAKKAAEAAAKQLKANQEQQKSLQEIVNSTIAGNTTISNTIKIVSTKERLAAQKALAELNLNMQITAEKAEATAQWQQSSAGQAVALKKELESQGKIAEDNKEFQKLSYQARKADYKKRLKDATSPAAKKEIREEARADAKKNGSRLDKIGAAVGGMWANSKKVLIGGAKALLSTLAIGGLLIALGKFLQSDTFKKMTAYIFDTIIPKLKEFYNAFFGEGGGLWTGIKALFGDDSGVGAVVIGLTAVTALMAVGKLAKIFGPLKSALGGLLSGIGGLAKRIPGMPGGDDASKLGNVAKAGDASKLGNVANVPGKASGAGIGGMLRGIAAGLGAMANPATLVGLLAVVAAVVALSAAIRIMTPAFEPIGKMFESFGETVKTVFEGLGVIIKDIGESIGKVITAIGDSIGNIIGKITSMKTAGTDATTKQIKELSAIPGNLMLETAKGIDAIKAALDGFGGGTFSQITGSLFGGGGPIEKIIKLSEKVPALMKAAEAISILGAAGSNYAMAEAEIERRKKVAELKKKIAGGAGSSYNPLSSSQGDIDKAKGELSALEGQAMPMGGPSNISGQVAQMKYGPGLQKLITVAINESEITTLEKDRVRREAEFKTASAGGGGGQTNIVDARQSSSVTTTGQTTGVIMPNKYFSLNEAGL
jgi:hypothetical protein